MSLRDDVKDWLNEGKEIKAKSPLCSKRLVVDNLWEVYGSAPNSRMVNNLIDTYDDINWANGCKIFSDRIIKDMDSDVACFNYQYFYDDKETEKTIVLHDTEETRLFSWVWDDEQKRRENW